MDFKQTICEGDDFLRLVSKLAKSIVDSYDNLDNLVFIGIKTRGVPLAKLISKEINSMTGHNIRVGIMDIGEFRDDKNQVSNKVDTSRCDIPFDVAGKDVILVDDVMYTARTLRAGVQGVISYGRPASIKIAVLAVRPGFLQMPILAEFVGISVDTTQDDIVSVSVVDIDKEYSIKVYSV